MARWESFASLLHGELTPDPECCDGSDEWATGACPDRCAEIAKEYRERTEREAKIRRTGGKIRGTYVSFAGKERQRLQDELKAKRAELTDKEAELSTAQAALKRAEDLSRDDLEKKKATRECPQSRPWSPQETGGAAAGRAQ